MFAVRRRFCLLVVALSLALSLVSLMACKESPTPSPVPQPIPRPTSTPDPEMVLDGALFTITLDGVLLGTEEIHVGHADDQLVLFSEIHIGADRSATERRSLLVSRQLDPLHYDLEAFAYGVRSTWVGERVGDTMSCLNNNLAWIAPVLIEGVMPFPQVMLDCSPSALPYALLALRPISEGVHGASAEPRHLHCLSVQEDYPVSRPLAMTVAPERTGAIIGTLALEGEIEGGRNPRFTMWIRPDTRALYSVEITDYSFGLWQQRAHPSMRHSGTLLIQRVSQLPELPIELPPGEARRTPLEFIGADGMTRKGTLILPKGEGPYPCFVLHSPGGAVPRWDPGDAFAERGWAVYAYDKRGIGESEGAFDRGSITALAADAVAAGEMLVARPELDPKRIVFLGLGEAGKVGAVAVTATDAFAAAVLGSCAWDGKAFPDLAQARIRNVLAPFHQWDEETIAAYQKVSISEWEGWLYQGQGEVSLLKRRVSLRGLREMAQFDLYATLSESRAPVLLLHGQDDDWTPVEGIERLRERGVADDGAHLTIQVFQGLGADLGGGTGEAVFASVMEEAIFSWLDGVLKEGT